MPGYADASGTPLNRIYEASFSESLPHVTSTHLITVCSRWS